jgi:hypothetical protein
MCEDYNFIQSLNLHTDGVNSELLTSSMYANNSAKATDSTFISLGCFEDLTLASNCIGCLWAAVQYRAGKQTGWSLASWAIMSPQASLLDSKLSCAMEAHLRTVQVITCRDAWHITEKTSETFNFSY